MTSVYQSTGVKMALLGGVGAVGIATGLLSSSTFLVSITGAFILAGLLNEGARRVEAPEWVQHACIALAVAVPGVVGIWTGFQNGDRTLAEYGIVAMVAAAFFMVSSQLPVDSSSGFLVLFGIGATYFLVTGSLLPAIILGMLAFAPARTVVQKRRVAS